MSLNDSQILFDLISAVPNRLMTPAEAAKFFRVNPKTIGQWCKKYGVTPVRTPTGQRRYHPEGIILFCRLGLANAKTAPAARTAQD